MLLINNVHLEEKKGLQIMVKQKRKNRTLIIGAIGLLISGVLVAGSGQSKSAGSFAGNQAGVIEGDVEMEGVAVINGAVFIDGEAIPHGKKVHVGKRSKKTYDIKWGKNGDVAVQER